LSRVRAISGAVARNLAGIGMQAWSTVPPVAGLVMSIVPLSASMRSRRLFRPLVSDRGRAPPIPSSRTSTANRSSSSSTRTQADVAAEHHRSPLFFHNARHGWHGWVRNGYLEEA
jgi:hypothetical protein